MNIIKRSRLAVEAAAAILQATPVYLVWRSKEDRAYIAIHAALPGLSGIAKSPEKALEELQIAIELAETFEKEDKA